MTEVTRTFDILKRYEEQFPGKPDALTPKVDGEWKGFSTEDYINYAHNLSY